MSSLGRLIASRAASSERVTGVVTNSAEFNRILSLPRRVIDLGTTEDVTPLFTKSGELSFWPIQSASLVEAALADGLFAPIGVGHGKTLIGLALPTALDSNRAVYLVKPDLKKQLLREAIEFYGRHFYLPLDKITVVSYSELSSAGSADILSTLNPDLIVADEAHCLRHADSARTKRFLRFARGNPGCRFAFLSGTMTNRSILDYAHLIELALRKNSPLPRGYYELRDWSGALDVNPEYVTAPGYLRHLCTSGESPREGFKRRLVETRGVVATEEGSLGVSLIVRKLSLKVPDVIQGLMREVRKSWALEGEEFSEVTAVVRAVKQLACGFYYRWVWPNDEPDYEWLEARRDWRAEVRGRLKYSVEGLDSPLLLEQAAERYRVWLERDRPRPFKRRGDLVLLPNQEGELVLKSWNSQSWRSWRSVKSRACPPVQPVWKSDYLVEAALAWAKKQRGPGIIWYEWEAVGSRIASLGGLPLYGAGTDASGSSDEIVVASIKSQGTGKNLQRYSRNLCTTLPSSGTLFEQLAGRTHRPGQRADEVVVEWFGHTPELEAAMSRVLDDAEFIQSTTGQRQKILYATLIE